MDDQLNRKVAEALGWRVIRVEAHESSKHDYEYQLVHPSGARKVMPSTTEEAAWKRAGQWSTSVDAALKLVPDHLRLDLSQYPRQESPPRCFAAIDTWARGDGDTPAVAICAAYLEWKKANAEDTP
jgi:hypothetical protein